MLAPRFGTVLFNNLVGNKHQKQHITICSKLILLMLLLTLLFLDASGFEVQALSVDAKKLDLPYPCHTPQQLSSVPGSFCGSAAKNAFQILEIHPRLMSEDNRAP